MAGEGRNIKDMSVGRRFAELMTNLGIEDRGKSGLGEKKKEAREFQLAEGFDDVVREYAEKGSLGAGIVFPLENFASQYLVAYQKAKAEDPGLTAWAFASSEYGRRPVQTGCFRGGGE